MSMHGNRVAHVAILIAGSLFLTRAGPSAHTAERLSTRCSCVDPGTPLEAQAAASALLLVRIERQVPMLTLFGRATGADRLVTARVLAAWPTGERTGLERARRAFTHKRVRFTTASSGTACGYVFDDRALYLVYAEGPQSDLATSSCTRTRPLEEAAHDLAALGQPAIDRRATGRLKAQR